MNEALSASVDTVAEGFLVFNAYLLVSEHEPDGVAIANSLASDSRSLALFHVVEA